MNDLYNRLIEFKDRKGYTNARIARDLNIPELYLYRWKKKGIKGIYAIYVNDYLAEKE
jgi:hypothetical protein